MAKKIRKKKARKEKIDKREAGKAVKKPEEIKSREKQIIFILALMLLSFAFVFIFSEIYRNAGTFNYEGMKFLKTKFGEITVYKSKLNIQRLDAALKYNYSLYLRNDPRLLDKIPMNASILFRKNAVISIEPELERCSDGGTGIMELGGFMFALGLKITGATTSKEFAEEYGKQMADCGDAANKTIIVFKRSLIQKTEIQQEAKDCYVVYVENCGKMTEAAERFIVAALAQMLNKPTG